MKDGDLPRTLWSENPLAAYLVGVCPALAVSNRLANALLLGAVMLFALLGTGVASVALERLLPRCDRQWQAGGQVLPLEATARNDIERQARDMACQGLRILALAGRAEGGDEHERQSGANDSHPGDSRTSSRVNEQPSESVPGQRAQLRPPSSL